MKHKSMKVTTIATALALSLTATAMAAAPTPGSGGGGGFQTGEVAANSDTTISILQTASTQPNISYTVPLYVTMAVVNNDTDVKVPSNYGLTNTTPADQTGNAPAIGVTNMSFEKLANSTFKTVATDTVNNADEIYLTIGKEPMPALSGVEAKSWKPTTSDIFWNATDKKPKPLTGYVDLPITGKVSASGRQDEATAAQFRVKYTVSLLTTSGDPLGAVYAGDDSTAAGLGVWNPNTNTWDKTTNP